jgi:hypothetical protein
MAIGECQARALRARRTQATIAAARTSVQATPQAMGAGQFVGLPGEAAG